MSSSTLRAARECAHLSVGAVATTMEAFRRHLIRHLSQHCFTPCNQHAVFEQQWGRFILSSIAVRMPVMGAVAQNQVVAPLVLVSLGELRIAQQLADLVYRGTQGQIGNGLAMWKHRRGETPAGVEGEFRGSRAWFLMAVGAVMATWGAVTIFT